MDGAFGALQTFDLERRLMRYPCSYMIYAAPSDALPAEAMEAIYKWIWEILSGTEKAPNSSTHSR